jgi:uncharacterized protein YfcZ (UPF0381/DUF406 family)
MISLRNEIYSVEEPEEIRNDFNFSGEEERLISNLKIIH